MKKRNKKYKWSYYCNNCNKRLNKKRDHINEPDPYQFEINHDNKPVDLCVDCYYQSLLDI